MDWQRPAALAVPPWDVEGGARHRALAELWTSAGASGLSGRPTATVSVKCRPATEGGDAGFSQMATVRERNRESREAE